MESFTKTLIECYAKYGVENVNQCEDFKTLCNKERGDFIFNEERRRIENLQRSIESEVSRSPTSREQIINALKLLDKKFAPKDNKKNKEDVEYIYELILKGYCNKDWRADQLDYFKKVYKAITTYSDYFLSFTNRKATKNNPNIVNFNHMYLIKWLCPSYREKKHFERESKENNNLLAKAIYYFLRSNKPQLRGFYYPVHEGDNQKVKEKLRAAAGNTFVFIQIIQNIMFSKNFDCENNYCFFEYCEAKRNISGEHQRILFILAEDSREDIIPKTDIWEKFENWYDEMVEKDKIILEYTKTYRPRQLEKLEDKIKKNLLNRVSEAKEKMIDKVPL
jgi:F0F1-type ATP synthase delta subunit